MKSKVMIMMLWKGKKKKKKNRGKRFYSFTVYLGYILPSYKNSLQSFSRLH